MQSDVLIIGSGIAGLSTAIQLADLNPELSITVLTKVNEGESNTAYAQGGVAAVWDVEVDNYEKHIADTLDAGDGLCDLDIVRIVVEEGPDRVREIIEWGARFDKPHGNDDPDAEYDLGREGGHSENRILHISMVYRAKGRIENMEFVQFHPTALFDPTGQNPAFLVSEAVRGFGGILKTPEGEEFMQKYDERGSLAPRDIVARAIDKEMKERGTEYMCLDCTQLDMEAFKAHFPTILEKCLSIGIDPAVDLIPVTPACHYMCGGVRVDEMGRSSIQALYACGECTSTGLHGANRLASNSLLEAMVFAKRIATDIAVQIGAIPLRENIPAWDAEGTIEPNELVLITQTQKELKEIMSAYVGIVRTDVRLRRAARRIEVLSRETEDLYGSTIISPQLCELRNLITIGHLVTHMSAMRRESRGLHFNTDYPEQLDFAVEHLV